MKDTIQKHYRKAVVSIQKCGNRLVSGLNRISTKTMVFYAAALLILSLIPLLLLGRYNVMCIDDYDFGIRVHDTWVETGSFRQSIQTAVIQTVERYRSWQGTYASCFLMALAPMNFRYETAFLVPVIMIGMFVMSAFFFGKQILNRWLGSDKTQASFVMLLVLFVFYQVIEAPFEGIYWYNGSVHYVFMESLSFIMLTLVSESLWTEKKERAGFCCVFAVTISLIVGGGNLVTGLQAEMLLLVLLVYSCVVKRQKLLYALIPFLTFTAAFLCNTLTPGNMVRVEASTGYSPIPAVILSFYYAGIFIIEWTSVFVILIWLALLPVLWQIGKKSEKRFEHPVWVTIAAVCILSAMFTPTLFGLGLAGLSRVDDIIQMVYYLCLFFVTTYWLGWMNHRSLPDSRKADGKQEVPAGERFGAFLESTGNIMTVACVILTLFIWVFTANKNTYTSISALRSLVNGDAKTYYEEAIQRYEVYTDESVTDVVVEPFSARPALFDFEDLSEDEEYWLNQAVKLYFHKNSVRRAGR